MAKVNRGFVPSVNPRKKEDNIPNHNKTNNEDKSYLKGKIYRWSLAIIAVIVMNYYASDKDRSISNIFSNSSDNSRQISNSTSTNSVENSLREDNNKKCRYSGLLKFSYI